MNDLPSPKDFLQMIVAARAMTNRNHITFADVLSLRDAVAQASDLDDAQFDAIAEQKAIAIDSVIDHGSTFDKLCVLVLLAADHHDVQALAASLLTQLTT